MWLMAAAGLPVVGHAAHGVVGELVGVTITYNALEAVAGVAAGLCRGPSRERGREDVGGEGQKKLARPSSCKVLSMHVSAIFDGEGPQLKKRTFPKVPPTFAELVMDFWLYSEAEV